MAATREVVAELGEPSVAKRAAMAEHEHKENQRKWREEARQNKLAFEERVQTMRDKRGARGSFNATKASAVEPRPFLFQQQSIDVRVLEEKQRAYDKFDATLRKVGLDQLLDHPVDV